MNISDVAKVGLGAFVALIGTLLSQRFTTVREEKKRRLEWCAKQLSEFYAPMAALRREILVLSDFRVRVHAIAEGKYREQLARVWGPERDPERYERHKDSLSSYMGPIDYFNAQYENELRPAYLKMREVFHEKMHYADADTLGFYETFILYQETQKIVAAGLPLDVFDEVRTMEKELHPFYDHIESRASALRNAVRTGRLPNTPRWPSRLGKAFGLPWRKGEA